MPNECCKRLNPKERTKTPVPRGIYGDSLTRRILAKLLFTRAAGIQRPAVSGMTSGRVTYPSRPPALNLSRFKGAGQ